MTCGQCGADLIGSGKFCGSCGAAKPTAPPLADANLLVLPEMPASGSLSGGVNPFAATAPPGSALPRTSASSDALKAVSGAMAAKPVSIEAKSESSPPAPLSPRAVSPLAVSNGISGRTPFQEAVEKARQSVAPAAQPKVKKAAGTQMMVNAPKRPGGKNAPADAGAPPSAIEEPKKRAVPKTVAMTPAQHQASSGTPSAAGGGAPQSVLAPGSGSGVGNAAPNSVIAPSGGGAGGAPQSVIAPSASGGAFGGGAPNSYVASQGYGAAPGSGAPGALGQQLQQQPPQSAYGQRPPPHQHAPQPLAPYQQPPAPAYPPPQWGAAPPSYGFQYAPGSRVQVTWSNGQRYPATVSQVNGPQCLVVFPDGQQHWVQLQYLTPG